MNIIFNVLNASRNTDNPAAPSLFLSLCIRNNKTAFILEDKNSACRQKNHKINPCKFRFFSWQTEIKAHYVLIADAKA